MDRLDMMRLFTRIVELGSFTAAAEDAHIPRANASYAIQQLEKRLGVRLLSRSTRHVSATPEGQAYYARCSRMLAELEETEAQLGTSAATPRGRLRIDLQPSLANMFILPRLGEFCARYPEIALVIGTGDRLIDLVREGVDCVVRGGHPRTPGLTARRVASFAVATCASRDYIARHGKPRTLAQFQRHQAVQFLSTATGRPMPFQFRVDGKLRDVSLRGPVCVMTADAYNACCQQGLGFIQTSRIRLEDQLKDGSLVEVLPRHQPPPAPIWVMYPQQRHLSPRVRVFVDWIAEVFRPLDGR